jgi:hypothetical protein
MFWRSTPAVINLATRSYNEREEAKNRQFLSLAWHIEALARQKRLPDFKKVVLGAPEEAQSDEEMFRAMQFWVASHNARYQQRRLLGIAEAGEC